jgi:hypothetical protein
MRAAYRLFSLITHALGGQRRLIRRIAALCLVLMGVHLSADKLDDVVYRLIDAVDLFVDDTVAGFLLWLSAAGGMAPEAAAHTSESFATWMDLAEKNRLAIALALVVELVLDVLLFDLAWGRHVDGGSVGLVQELKDSARQMIDALRPLDLERLAVMPTLIAFAVGGASGAALAVEGIARDALHRRAPDFLWGGHVAAGLGILAGCVLLWRFLPDLLHGALLRSRSRHDVAREKALRRLDAPHRFPRLARAITLLRLGSRGTWLLVLALPLALAGLLSSDLIALIQRVEVVPG